MINLAKLDFDLPYGACYHYASVEDTKKHIASLRSYHDVRMLLRLPASKADPFRMGLTITVAHHPGDRFCPVCVDITSHPRGYMSDATTSLTRTPRPVRTEPGPTQNRMRGRLWRGFVNDEAYKI